MQKYVDGVGGVGDAGITSEYLPERAAEQLREAGKPEGSSDVLCRFFCIPQPAEEGLPLPDVMKIDVEGAEPLLLRGAAGLLRERRPKLVVELHGAAVAREVITLLDGFGYACAATVSPRIHASGYGPVDLSTLPQVKGLYDVHFLVAASDPAALPASWEAG